LFQNSVFLFGGCRAGFHAALLAANTHPDHVERIVFVDLIGNAGMRFVAIGAGEGGVIGGRV
jgi:pimeloyl-ACP methyl ester carboxylesterase